VSAIASESRSHAARLLPRASNPRRFAAGSRACRVPVQESRSCRLDRVQRREFLAAEEPQLLQLVAARQPLETSNLHRVDGEINRATFPSGTQTILDGSVNTLNKPADVTTSPVSSRTLSRRASWTSTPPPPTRPQRPQPLRRSSSSAPSRSIRTSTPQRQSAGSAVECRGPGRRTRPCGLQASGFGSQERPGRRRVTPAPPRHHA
jgi:hypothetical protein